MESGAFELELIEGTYCIVRLSPDAALPDWASHAQPFVSITRSEHECSIVAHQEHVPDAVTCERGFRALRVAGTLDFNLIGILATLTAALARARVSVFAVSTYDTDYLLVREVDLPAAMKALRSVASIRA